MLNNFFLTYANNHFLRDPMNMDKVFSEMISDDDPEKRHRERLEYIDKGGNKTPFRIYHDENDARNLKKCFELMKEFALCTYNEAVELRRDYKNNGVIYDKDQGIRRPLSKEETQSPVCFSREGEPLNETQFRDYLNYLDACIWDALIDYAFYAVHGYCREKCEDCLWNPKKMDFYNFDYVMDLYAYPEVDQLFCHECRQFRFICVLFQVIDPDVSFGDIGAYDGRFGGHVLNGELLRRAYLPIRHRAHFIKGKFQKETYFDSGIRFYEMDEETCETLSSVNHFIFNAAVYSLFEFIQKHDRRKIRKCKECGNFYVTKTIRPSDFCSDKCRLKFHNRTRIASGEHAAYKRKKRRDGAKGSYY